MIQVCENVIALLFAHVQTFLILIESLLQKREGHSNKCFSLINSKYRCYEDKMNDCLQ